MSHPMTNSMWVTLLYCSLINLASSHDQQGVSDTALWQSHQSCLIPWPTACEWYCLIAVSSLMSHPITNSLWVTLLDSDARQSHQCSFCDQQGAVSDTVLCPPLYHPIHDQQVVSPVKVSTMLFHSISYDEQQMTVSDMPSLPVTSLHMINRRWVTVHLFSCYDLISWLPTASEWCTT